jgi:hypothetical protein
MSCFLRVVCETLGKYRQPGLYGKAINMWTVINILNSPTTFRFIAADFVVYRVFCTRSNFLCRLPSERGKR